MVEKVFVINWFSFECEYGTKRHFICKYTDKIAGKPKYWTEKTFSGEYLVFRLVQETQPDYKRRCQAKEQDWFDSEPGYQEDDIQYYMEADISVDKLITPARERNFRNTHETADYEHFVSVNTGLRSELVFPQAVDEKTAIDFMFSKVMKHNSLEYFETKHALLDGFRRGLYRTHGGNSHHKFAELFGQIMYLAELDSLE